MIPKLNDFLDLFESIAPSGLAEPWDNPGLQVGSPFSEVNKVLIALDPTLEVVSAASRCGAQLLLTHHPLIFAPLSSLDTSKYPGKVISTALEQGISIISAHTNLDSAKDGINDILAELLDLQDIRALQDSAETDGSGLGRIGDLPGRLDFHEFIARVKKIFGLGTIRVAGKLPGSVNRVAVVGGAGSSLLETACGKGADVLLTGDVGYHRALEAGSLGIAVLDGGHFCTEKRAMQVFAERLKDLAGSKDWEVVFEVDEGETDPFMCL